MKIITQMIFLVFLASTPVIGQDLTEVKVSAEKRTENGVHYYIHKVEKGQTLYRIARTYNVSVGDILKHNPFAAEGIQPEMELRIVASVPAPEIPSNAYIFHIVRKGETLKTIAGIYGVSERDIQNLNAGLGDKLSVDQVIKIPMDYSGIGTSKPDTTRQTEKDQFVQYEVAEKETLYSIARKYNVTIADLLEWNPELKAGLKKGQVIKIGKPSQRQRDNGFFEYKVGRKESLYGIARKNRISIDSLKLYNPGLTEQINEGQVLLIPVRRASSYITHIPATKENITQIAENYQINEEELKKANPGLGKKVPADEPVRIPVEKSTETEPSQEKDNKVETDSAEIEICAQSYNHIHEEFRIALILPFNLDASDASNTKSARNRESTGFRYLPFYEGAYIALDSLKKKGLKAKIFVYDIGHDPEIAKRILSQPEMKQLDLIISLSFTRSFELIADFGKKNNIPVVNPVSRRDEIISNNPSVIKVFPSPDFQAETVVQFLKSRPTRQNIVLIRSNKIQHTQLADRLRTLIQETLNAEGFAKGSRFMYLNDSLTKVNKALKPGYDNYLIALSENEAFSINLLSQLSHRDDTLRFSLIGLPLWEEMKNIESTAILRSNLHFVTPSFVDYSDPDVQKFVETFRREYLSEPGELAFTGFDVTWYFVNALMINGRKFPECVTNLHVKTIQSKYRFLHKQPNGYINTFWNIYHHAGYQPVILNR